MLVLKGIGKLFSNFNGFMGVNKVTFYQFRFFHFELIHAKNLLKFLV